MPAPVLAPPATGAAIEQPRSRWVPVRWDELPGWKDDQVAHVWPALLRSCERPAPGWSALCIEARALRQPDEATARAWLQQWLRPFRVEAKDGRTDGLLTGYYEPTLEASRVPRAGFRVPLHAPPASLATRRPWWTRAEIEQLPSAQAALRGLEIAYVADPLDALVLQIQGSGRLVVAEPDGRRQMVRLAYAGHNDHPYRSVGRWLVDQGAMTLDQASWPSIKAWARANPQRVGEMMNVNPRYVFFREQPIADPAVGALGAQGVPLTPGRSIAVDRQSVPYGTPVWIDATEPPVGAAATRAGTGAPPPRPLQRLVMAQDTGSAIVGAVRADYYWGWAEGAEERAGRTKQPLRMWVLWPKS
ncbi:murein transglycosylase A [Caldimonas tepidiphila]|uniref:murein transglycosylase A n=1 Tax=Caldimonas tepidiphila TaxID=2315841 RepID=UPI001F0C3B82|nr:MltA domain-containing protein [Caldimonas tepidiphila]